MTAWMVRAGKSGEREQWAIDRSVTGAGFEEVADLTEAHDREQVQAAAAAAYPQAKPTAVRNFAAQLWALRGRMSKGDLVVMPLKLAPQVAIGKINGDYAYLADEPDPTRRHIRPVEWLVTDVPRSVIKQDLLYSLGAFSTICQISRNDAESRLRVILETGSDPGSRSGVEASGHPSRSDRSTALRDGEDEEVLDTAQAIDVARYAADRIVARTIETFAGHRLAELVGAVLETEGFRCDVMPEGPDKGVDIIAGKGLLGLESPRIVVQVKSEAGHVGAPIVQQLQGAITMHRADCGLLVAWGGVTKQAKELLSTQRFAISVWDSETLLAEVLKHYRDLPDAVRADLPLTQIWTLAEEAG
ncbi:restriction endonuclease [Mycobacterium intracellulare]|uniref:restriction endonuclease n=1 Tax=Mycobacterium intracellulare TaxID=1767 RepID=UPI0034D740EC